MIVHTACIIDIVIIIIIMVVWLYGVVYEVGHVLIFIGGSTKNNNIKNALSTLLCKASKTIFV